MSDVNGIPNMGFLGGGGGYFGGDASRGLPAMSADQINASMGFNPNAAQFDPWANSPGGFGAQTDYYSGLGAAYGRDTGGFNASPGYPAGPVESAPLDPLPYQNPFEAAPPPDYSGGGIGSDAAAAPYQNPYSGGIGSDAVAAPYQSPYGTGYGEGVQPSAGGGIGSDAGQAPGGVFDQSAYYGPMYRQPDANPEAFNPGTFAGDQNNFGIPFNGAPLPGDIGFSPQPTTPNLGYNPGMENWFANPGMGGGGFVDRFGQWGADAGTPSQYTTAPYTSTPGQTFEPNIPPGYMQPYGFDQPNGALPWLGGGVGNSQAGG